MSVITLVSPVPRRGLLLSSGSPRQRPELDQVGEVHREVGRGPLLEKPFDEWQHQGSKCDWEFLELPRRVHWAVAHLEEGTGARPAQVLDLERVLVP